MDANKSAGKESEESKSMPVPRRTMAGVGHAKIRDFNIADVKLPEGYPLPYPQPFILKMPVPGHPLPLEALYAREADSPSKERQAPPAGAAGSQRLVYQTNHESHVRLFRLRRRSEPTRNMDYPRYPWNDEGTLLVPPPELGYGFGGLAGDGSLLPRGVSVRMTRHYFYLDNQIENYSCDLRDRSFTVKTPDGIFTYTMPPFPPEVVEEGGSHGEQEWTPAPGPEAVYYWPVCLDPRTIGNLGGGLNIEKPGADPVFLMAMQGWLIRPTQQPQAVMFFEGPYISHESLAYYHGPADRYPGFDRNRIAVIAWWAPPKLREYRVYDGNGKLIRSYATGSDRVHMAWGDHGNYIIGDSGYDWKYPGTMTVFFPDTGAIRPIGYHDNAYYTQKGQEHPHPAASPDGTKLIYKCTHMDRLHGLEIMVVPPPWAPMAALEGGHLTWRVRGVNSEINRFRIFHMAESGSGYQFVAEVSDSRSPAEKLRIVEDYYTHRWPIPAGQRGYFLVCSVEGSGLMSGASNEVAVGVRAARRIFVRAEDMLTDRATAYLAPDGDATSMAVVRQAQVQALPGESQPGDPVLQYTLPETPAYTVHARMRGKGAASFGLLGSVTVDSTSYQWYRLGDVKGGSLKVILQIDEGVRLDQFCLSSDRVCFRRFGGAQPATCRANAIFAL